MIQTFADRETERLWLGIRSKKLPAEIQPRALATMRMIDAAEFLDDLKTPLSNRLHALSHDRAGQHSVSINMKWRICFRWKDGNAYNVEVTNHYD